MNRINATFASLKQSGRKGLIAFCTAHYPNQQEFGRFLHESPQAGVDIIEVGMPFSDPIADGPTIQISNRISLESNTSLKDIFTAVAGWRKTNTETPLVLMGYYNPVLQYGEQQFLAACKEAGVDGLIMVDLPPEESSNFDRLAMQQGVAIIRLITPTTREERMNAICANLSNGFVYYVAVTGVTGMKKGNTANVNAQLASLRKASELPIAVGFGISEPEEARVMASAGDAIVVGSALIRAIEAGGVTAGLDFIGIMRTALDS